MSRFVCDRVIPSGCGAVGSARRLGRRCRRFEPCHSDQNLCFLHQKSVLFARLGLIFCLLSPFCSFSKKPQFLPKRFLSAQDTDLECFYGCFERIFSNPFSLISATQFLRADGFGQPYLLTARQIEIYYSLILLICLFSHLR